MIYIASDHAGFERKEKVRAMLKDLGQEVKDLGPAQMEESDDYPDYAFPLAEKVAREGAKGVLLCGNGVGVCVAANKVKGVRAVLAYNEYAAQTSREDDDTNVLCLPGRILSDEEIAGIVKKWLDTGFSGEERHTRRINKIKEKENSYAG